MDWGKFSRLALCLVALTCLPLGNGQSSRSSGDSGDDRLPVTRVILYKNGVGYFEHSGRVRGSQDVNIDFTTSQLNDVLKSLTVLDLGKGHITGVSYNSTAPLDRRLGALRLPVGDHPTTPQFLGALRGTRVEVSSGSSSATGRLLSVDQRDLQLKGEEKITVYQVSLVTDSGEVRSFDLTPATNVRIAEKDVNEEVGKYLKLLASSRDQDVRRMSISTAGDGERGLLVSYISEVPVWKSTYRIVVPADGKPLLQGWAIVDNTVGEDWKNVELSLVAGAPQSFVQELSQPYYTRRPVVALPENAMVTPQTYEATMEKKKEDARLKEPTRIPAPGPPRPMKSISVGVVGGVPGGAYRMNSTVEVSTNPDLNTREAAMTVAQTAELGDLFEYKLKDRITIQKNQSALVPILQSRVDAEKVSVWNPSQSAVLRGLWLDNTSGLTLDGGSFNVLEDDAFSGEGLMEPIKPGEKRLLSYAVDLGMLVEAKQNNDRQHVTRIVIARGTMFQTTQETQEQTYTIRNRDTQARTLVIEHPARLGWKLADDADPAESSASFHRFRVKVDPKTTQTLLVKEYRPIVNRYELTNINDDQIRLFLSQKMINTDIEKALRRVLGQKNEVAAIDADIASHKTQLTGIAEDQQRVRENMKALKGSAEEKALVERYARELNQQEDRVQFLQREMSTLHQKRDTAQKTLNDMIQGLALETTL
jgi:hypothetical protein